MSGAGGADELDVRTTSLVSISFTGGKDEIRAQDGVVDKIRCGFDADVVKADAADELTEIQPQDVCETVSMPGGPPGPAAARPLAPGDACCDAPASAEDRPRAGLEGPPARASCSQACTMSARLVLGRKVLAHGRARRTSAGTVTITLRVPARRRRSVARLRRKTLSIASRGRREARG